MNEEDGYMDYYIEIGAVDLVGVDKSGEFIFRITDKAQEVAPELWKAHAEHVDEMLVSLFDKGLLDLSYDEQLNASFTLTEEGHAEAEKMGLIEMFEQQNEDDKPL